MCRVPIPTVLMEEFVTEMLQSMYACKLFNIADILKLVINHLCEWDSPLKYTYKYLNNSRGVQLGILGSRGPGWSPGPAGALHAIFSTLPSFLLRTFPITPLKVLKVLGLMLKLCRQRSFFVFLFCFVFYLFSVFSSFRCPADFAGDRCQRMVQARVQGE